VTPMPLASAVKSLRLLLSRPGVPLLIGLGVFAAYAAGRCSAPGPAKPSRDSTGPANTAKLIDSVVLASARRDSARNATVDSLMTEVGNARQIARIALLPRPKPVQPVGTAPDSVRWLVGRVDTLEAENDSLRAGWGATLVTDSLVIDGLRHQFTAQQAETAALRDLLDQAADSLRRAAVVIGRLERQVATRGCRKLLGVPLPEPGVGFAGIVGVDGKPGYGPAVSLSWRAGCLVR
jgi:hypothetical protein